MKNAPFLTVATAAAVLALAGAAGAQTAPSAGATSSITAGAGTSLNGKTASDLIGKSVYNAAGERIGEIDDIVIDGVGAAGATAAVIGVGGFLGMGERKVAVPLRDLDMRDNRVTAAALTKDSVRTMGEYREGSGTWTRYDRSRPFTLSGRSSTDSSVTAATGATTAPSGSMSGSAGTSTRAAPAQGRSDSNVTAATGATPAPSGTMSGSASTTTRTDVGVAAWAKGMSADKLIGKSVYNAAGDRIGEIDDLVVGKAGGAATTSAVVGVGGFLGIGERKVAVPLRELEMRNDRLTSSNLTKESVKTMAEYKTDDGMWTRLNRSTPLGG